MALHLPHSSLGDLSHRPWPLPEQPWKWRQSWQQLAFIHYRADAGRLQTRLPAGLTIQEYDGSAWLGVVPFRMAEISRGTLPSISPLKRFPELNLRTYVEHSGRSGVWFFSLDADCWPLVIAGRNLYGLPYYKAKMAHVESPEGIAFSSIRARGSMRFHGRYRPVGPIFFASDGSFEHWATERYCLYSQKGADTLRLEVHHRPWPLQVAEAEIQICDIFRAADVTTNDPSPRCHFSTGVDVISFSPEKLRDHHLPA